MNQEFLRKFFQATNPIKTLFRENREEDQKYYIDFSSVRGGKIVEDLKDNISLWAPDEPTCQLFTGHVGCGKSTELLVLKAKLEGEGFHVVYLDSAQDLEMNDVDVGDILLAIAGRVSESLKAAGINIEAGYLKQRCEEIVDALKTPIKIPEVELGFTKITTEAKGSPTLRERLRGYLESRTSTITEEINSEILKKARQKLKQSGKKGLVVIVDNLEKMENAPKPWGRPQQEYLFADRGEQLRGLNCHVVYTMPLALRFCDDYGNIIERFGTEAQVLPMVPVKWRDGSECAEGMNLLQQMVMGRAFPDANEGQRLDKIAEIFDKKETLDRLCRISGGHVRSLLRFVNDAIKRERGLPISGNTVEAVIRAYRNERTLAIDAQEWELLSQVAQSKEVAKLGDRAYKKLIRSRLVYEYHDREQIWFDINPILAEAKEFNL